MSGRGIENVAPEAGGDHKNHGREEDQHVVLLCGGTGG